MVDIIVMAINRLTYDLNMNGLLDCKNGISMGTFTGQAINRLSYIPMVVKNGISMG